MSALPSEVRLASMVLGIHPPFDEMGVQRAFRAAAREAHPDAGGTADLFRAATDARDVLLRFMRRQTPPPRWESEGVPRGWWRSKKGNATRKIACAECGRKRCQDARWITVFRSDGGYKFVCDDRFSAMVYPSEWDACMGAESYYGLNA